ncbi:MAG: hypothetical protein RIQ56_249 [Candidatus Parcubacteria bacterium]
MLNGATDACNVASSAACTGIFTRSQALWIAAISNAAGALIAVFILNTNIAKIIGKGIVDSNAVSLQTIIAAMVGIIGWAAFAWLRGLPISKSHSLVGALCGAAFASKGMEALIPSGLVRIAIGFLVGPIGGFTAGYLAGVAMKWLSSKPWRWVKMWLGDLDYISQTRPGQIGWGIWITQGVTTTSVGLAHGANDATKFMGILGLVLYKGGATSEFVVTNEIVLLCALVMAFGTLAGGWRITERVGTKMVNQQDKPLRGISAETASGTTINAFTFFDVPASTTLVFVPTMAGANYVASKRDVSRRQILLFVAAWIYTFPICFGIGWAMASLIL